MRKLIVSNSINMNGSKEFNHVRIVNIDDFFNAYGNNFDYYRSPFEILADLEKEVKFLNEFESCYLISYKPEGECIFDFIDVKEIDRIRVVTFKYMGSVS